MSTWYMLGAVVLALMLPGCSGSGNDPETPVTPSPPPSSGTPPPAGGGTTSTTIMVTATGVTPLELTIPVGSRVTFQNVDARPHDFSGGPDPSRPECPEIDQAGFVAAGQSRQTGVFTTARTCQYHDHTYIGVPAFMGRIVIQ